MKRGSPAEVCAAKICREGGARVRENQFLRDLNAEVASIDGRRIEVIANGLPLWGGKQVAIDTTVVSAMTGTGQARSDKPGQALQDAKRRKEIKYPELVKNNRCHLLVMGFEVAGRWSKEAVDFLRGLAKYKAESSPALLRGSAQALFFQRWTGLMACAVQRAYAASLLGQLDGGDVSCVNSPPFPVAELDRLL